MDHHGLQTAVGRLLNLPEGSLSPQQQERILFVLSQLREDRSTAKLVASLASRCDLSREVYLKLSGDRTVEVRAAWLARQGHDPDVLSAVLESERRVKALCAAVANPETPVETALRIVAEGWSLNLLLSAVTAEGVDDRVRLDALMQLSTTDGPIPSSSQLEVQSLIRARVDMRRLVLAHGIRKALLQTAAGAASPEDLRVSGPGRIADLLVIEPLRRLGRYSNLGTRDEARTQGIAEIGNKLCYAAADLLGDRLATMASVADRVLGVLGPARPSAGLKLLADNAAAGGARVGPMSAEEFRAALRSDDPSAAIDVAVQLTAPSVPGLQCRLVSWIVSEAVHDGFLADRFHLLCRETGPLGAVIAEYIRQSAPFGLEAGFAAEVAANTPDLRVAASILANSVDPVEAARRFSERGDLNGSYVIQHLLDDRPDLCREIFLSVPVAMLPSMAGLSDSISESLLEQLSDAVSVQLFCELAPGFSGTVGELFDMVKAVG